MDLKELFRLKYDLLEKLEHKEFKTREEKEAYEEGINAFFVDVMAQMLEPESKKKAS